MSFEVQKMNDEPHWVHHRRITVIRGLVVQLFIHQLYVVDAALIPTQESSCQEPR